MRYPRPDDPTIQIVGEPQETPVHTAPTRRRLGLLIILGSVVFVTFVAVRWVGRPPDDERTLRAFAAAIDSGDRPGARGHIEDPTIISWPTYWSFLNIEHISPFGDRLDDFIDYQHALGTRTQIGNCEARPTGPGEPTGYDSWLRCDYRLGDELSSRLAGPAGSTTGQLSVGFRDGKIRTVFVIRSDQPSILSRFRAWVTSTFPDTYAELLAQPAVLQLDIPIVGLVVTDYNAATATALIEFADAYAAAGFP